MHVGGPSAPIPGGGHIRFGGDGAATAGLIGYGAYEAAQMEDAVWQLIYHSGQENNDANRSRFRKILQDSMRDSGYGLHGISESAKQESACLRAPLATASTSCRRCCARPRSSRG